MGEVVVTAGTPGLVHVLGTAWPMAFVLWTAPLGLLVALFLVGGSTPFAPVSRQTGEGVQGVAWQTSVRLGTLMSGSASMYFAANAYLPRILTLTGQDGLIAPALGILNASQLMASGWLIWRGGRALQGKATLTVFALCAGLGLAGLCLLPAGWLDLPMAGTCGFGTAGMLTLILSRATHTGEPAVSRRVVAGTLFIGYTLAFLLPSLGGWLADLSAWPVAALMPPLFFGGIALVLIVIEPGSGPPRVQRPS